MPSDRTAAQLSSNEGEQVKQKTVIPVSAEDQQRITNLGREIRDRQTELGAVLAKYFSGGVDSLVELPFPLGKRAVDFQGTVFIAQGGRIVGEYDRDAGT